MKYFIIIIALLFIVLGRRTVVNIIRRSLGFGPIGSEKRQSTISHTTPKRKKVFGKNDGEYVEYEEIKNKES
jgi:hypothetical protein